jgi:heptosyltransferase II
MADRVVYIMALAALGIVRILPLGVCFGLGRVLGHFLWLILPGYRRLARENLETAFGAELDPAAIRSLVRKHFAALGANALSAMRIPALRPEEIDRIAVIENLDSIRKIIAGGRPVVLAINHIGNWELYAQLVHRVPEARFGTVYQSLHNQLVDDLVNRDRRRLGVLTFDRKEGFQGALALLREPGILGVLVDQHAGNSGVWTPFFGRLASTSPLASTLAIRTGAAVVPVAIHTDGFARWRVVVGDEIPWTADKPDDLTLAINRSLEQQIRVSPADWFWVHNRWKTPKPNFLCAGAKRGVHLPSGVVPEPFTILVRSPNWLGDAVMSVDAVRAIKAGRPDARVAVSTPAKLAGLWRRVGEVDEVVEVERSVWRTAAAIRGHHRVAVLFPNSLRSALEVWLAGIPRRVGYAGHSRKFLLNQIVPDPPAAKGPVPMHHADRYMRVATRCGAGDVAPRRALWRRPEEDRPVFAVCPGAEYGPAKRWPAYKFQMMMKQVAEQIDCHWVVVGTAADSDIAAEVASHVDQVTDLTGKTSLEDLMDLLARVDGLVTNDTGTMHLADFLGTPLVAIFGSTEPALTGPRGPMSKVIRNRSECSPCFLRECPIDFRCMLEIPMEEVVEAVIAMAD